MERKKELAIVFGITKNLDYALANVLIGIKKHFSENNYDIIVYHDGLSNDTKNCLSDIVPCKFILYKNKLNLSSVSSDYLKLYSNMCLARYECFDLLDKYKKIIWHDVDILIQKDFKDLLNYGNKSGLAMTYTDIGFLNEANFNELIPGYNMFLPLINSGIIVFSDKLIDYEKMTNWCYSKLEELASKIKYIDQGILNLLVQEFDIKVESIDISKYCCHPYRKNVQNASIVHSYGYDKFWNSIDLQKKFPEWNDNLNTWCKIIREYNNKNKNKIIVSVIMSVYERTTFLEEAIESILNQTFKDFELIIVVEKSENQNRINDFISKFKDKRIVIINNKEKLGFAESLNLGIKMAKGKYIARMDDDDISLPLRLQIQVEYLEKNPNTSILGSAVQVFMLENRLVYPQTDSEKIKTYTLINNQMYHPTIMMRKSDIEKFNLYYNKDFKTEDTELWSRAARYVKMENLKDVLLKYRISNENETQTAKSYVFDSDIRIIQKQLKENLNLDIDYNDVLYLNGRISRYSYLNNSKEILRKKMKIAKIVYKKNKKVKYYNQKYLAEVLELNTNGYTKRFIKFLLKPIYSRLMYRVSVLIDEKLANYK